ncbi:BgTH12-03892 [Blumeria graminis f. sp. triticale]|uniref:BgTH12-03892 n=1 Tax=Blumeria graminis f. sp. triticale TaxID=1689686 RepID=A0A9W4D1V8_BLUGR|nr:BgTH12-03892 [Blumeria graminis f. sp. triticale]
MKHKNFSFRRQSSSLAYILGNRNGSGRSGSRDRKCA